MLLADVSSAWWERRRIAVARRLGSAIQRRVEQLAADARKSRDRALADFLTGEIERR